MIEFRIWSTMDCRVGCPGPIEKIFYLLENYLKILACSQVSDHCPLGYLLYKWKRIRINLILFFLSPPTLTCLKKNSVKKINKKNNGLFGPCYSITTTPQHLYNTVLYNTISDITHISAANMEIDLDLNNSDIKRLWCITIHFTLFITQIG